MSSKKIMIILLTLGALAIVALLGIGYTLSSKFKSELQNTLNNHFEKIKTSSNDLFHSVDFIYEPFVCKGIKSYHCLSKQILFVDTATKETMVGLNNLSLSVKDISTSSVGVSIDLPKLSLEIFDKSLSHSPIYEAFKPTALKCAEEDKILNKKTGEINSNFKCVITSDNIEYHYDITGKIRNENFIDKNILRSMLSYYSNLSSLGQMDKMIEKYDFGIDKVSFKIVASKNIKDVVYSALEKDYKVLNPQSVFDDKAYQNQLKMFRAFATIALTISGISQNSYQEVFANFLEGLEEMALGNASEVDLTLLSKTPSAPYFQPNRLFENILKEGIQQEFITKLVNHYNLVSQTIMNTSDESKQKQ